MKTRIVLTLISFSLVACSSSSKESSCQKELAGELGKKDGSRLWKEGQSLEGSGCDTKKLKPFYLEEFSKAQSAICADPNLQVELIKLMALSGQSLDQFYERASSCSEQNKALSKKEKKSQDRKFQLAYLRTVCHPEKLFSFALNQAKRYQSFNGDNLKKTCGDKAYHYLKKAYDKSLKQYCSERKVKRKARLDFDSKLSMEKGLEEIKACRAYRGSLDNYEVFYVKYKDYIMNKEIREKEQAELERIKAELAREVGEKNFYNKTFFDYRGGRYLIECEVKATGDVHLRVESTSQNPVFLTGPWLIKTYDDHEVLLGKHKAFKAFSLAMEDGKKTLALKLPVERRVTCQGGYLGKRE